MRRAIWLVLAATLLLGIFAAQAMAADEIRIISVNNSGQAGNGHSSFPDFSVDGRIVAFWSAASNLVAGDSNARFDIFVRDRVAAQTTRVSVSSSGAQANGSSIYPNVGGDGRYIVFQSDATNLVDADTNGTTDIFLRDRVAATTTRVSISGSNQQANGPSRWASVSDDGRYVAFYSSATNLIDGQTGSGCFVRDTVAGTTTRIGGAGSDDDGRTAISGDGRYVVFLEDRRVMRYDRVTAVKTVIWDTPAYDGCCSAWAGRPKTNSDGKTAVFSGGEESGYGLKLYDALSGNTTDIRPPWQYGDPGRADVNADGRYVVYETGKPDYPGGWWMYYIYRLDRFTNQITLLVDRTADSGGSEGTYPTADGSGRYIAYASNGQIYSHGPADSTPPTTTATFEGANRQSGWYSSEITVTLAAADETGGTGVAATEYSFNGTEWAAYTGPFKISTAGVRTLSYRSRDVAGNQETAKTWESSLDRVAPTTTAVLEGSLGSNGWYISDVLVALSAVDDEGGSGVAGIEHNVDGSYEGTFTVSAEGTSTVWYRSTDSAGNTESTKERTIRIDKTAPAASATLIGTRAEDGAYLSTVIVDLEAHDNPGGSGIGLLEYSFDGTTWEPYVDPLVLTQSATVRFRATDVAGRMCDVQQRSVSIR